MKSTSTPKSPLPEPWNTYGSRFKQMFTRTFTWFTGYDIIWRGSRSRKR